MAKAKKTSKNTKSAKNSNEKFSLINTIHAEILKSASISKSGEIKLKRTDVKNLVEGAFIAATRVAASGQKVRFPVIGNLMRKDVPARKAQKGLNPFTGEEIMMKARPESKKPKWSFPKGVKLTFADKKNW